MRCLRRRLERLKIQLQRVQVSCNTQGGCKWHAPAGDRTGDGALSAAAPRALDLAPVAISAALCAASDGRGAAADALLPGRVGLRPQ